MRFSLGKNQPLFTQNSKTNSELRLKISSLVRKRVKLIENTRLISMAKTILNRDTKKSKKAGNYRKPSIIIQQENQGMQYQAW